MLSDREKRQLQSFCEICDAIAECRFIREFFNQPHHIFVGKLPDGTIKDEWPRYDDDDFRALMTHYRKLRLEDDTKYERIVNIVKRVSDTNDRQKLEHATSEIKEEGQGWWGASLQDNNGDWLMFNQQQLEDLILNGEVFHTEPDKQFTLRQLTGKSSLMKSIAFWNYLRYVSVVIHYATETAKMIREHDYLD